MSKEDASRILLNCVITNDMKRLDKFLSKGSSHCWREIICYEFQIERILAMDKMTKNCYLTSLQKLRAYGVETISTLHLAVICNYGDIVMKFLKKDTPVDHPLTSGTTALHLAAFAGHVRLFKQLVNELNGNLHLQDRYGWTVLHYASTEGHLEMVKVLVEVYKVDINIHDKDGTTAAFRADINNYSDVTAYLCDSGGQDELFTVLDSLESDLDQYENNLKDSDKESFIEMNCNPVYSTFTELAKLGITNCSNSTFNNELIFGNNEKIDTDVVESIPKSVTRKVSGKNTIRRLIRSEIENAFSEDDYMKPRDLKRTAGPSTDMKIGRETLQYVMRDELIKFKKENRRTSLSDSGLVDDTDSSTYDFLPPAPSIPELPELPPRNRHSELCPIPRGDVGTVRLPTKDVEGSQFMDIVFKISPKIGANWKKVAWALPLYKDNTKTKCLVNKIENTNPSTDTKRTCHMLLEWRKIHGKSANIEQLIIALHYCGLQKIITDIKKFTG